MARAVRTALFGIALLAGCHVGIHISTTGANVESSGNDLRISRGDRRVVLAGANGWGAINVQQNEETLTIRFPDRSRTAPKKALVVPCKKMTSTNSENMFSNPVPEMTTF